MPTAEPCKQTKGYPSIAKRSTADYTESDRVRLATLIMQQDELYKPRPGRVRRELPPANRSVLFVVDSSGSISRDEFKKVTSLLAEIAKHLCGEVAVGMLTYSTHIRLHFCPTCLRYTGITEAQYRERVADWIRGVQYHGHFTLTGEVVQCLKDHVMTDVDCVFSQTKPTHIVFFTDGLDNGCQNVNRAAKELVSRHTNAEIYAIGIGNNIRTSGVADLQTDPDSQTIFFNFNTLAQLVSSWEVFKSDYIETGNYTCLPVDFGK